MAFFTRKVLLACCAALAVCLLTVEARAGDGFAFDATSLLFDYVVIDAEAENGEVIGQLEIADGTPSRLVGQKLDLGADGAFGGDGADQDVLIDLAVVNSSLNFDVLFQADVIRMGPNDYRIESTFFGLTDSENALDNPSLSGSFVSDELALDYGVLAFTGSLAVLAGADSVLQPGDAENWFFKGLAGDTPSSPDEDGIAGWMSLDSGRSSFTEGRLAEFHFTGLPGIDLDTFFSAPRNALSADFKISVVPEPATLALMVVGAATCIRRGRRW